MMQEGIVAEDLSHIQSRKAAASHILMGTLFHKRKMIKDIIINTQPIIKW